MFISKKYMYVCIGFHFYSFIFYLPFHYFIYSCFSLFISNCIEKKNVFIFIFIFLIFLIEKYIIYIIVIYKILNLYNIMYNIKDRDSSLHPRFTMYITTFLFSIVSLIIIELVPQHSR